MGLLQVQLQVQLLLSLLASGAFTLVATQGRYLLMGRGNFKLEAVEAAVVEPLILSNLISVADEDDAAGEVYLPTAEGLRAVRQLNEPTQHRVGWA